MLRIRKQMKTTQKMPKTPSRQGNSSQLSNRGVIMPKDLLFDSNSTLAKIHTTRSSAILKKDSFEGVIAQTPKIKRKSKFVGIEQPPSDAISSSQNTQEDRSILVSVKSALIYPKDLSASKQNKIYRRSLKKNSALNSCRNTSQQEQHDGCLVGSFVSRLNQTEIVPLTCESFEEKEDSAQQRRPLRKNTMKRLTQIVVQKHELAECQNIHKKFQKNLEDYMKFIRNQCFASNVRFHQLPSYPKGFLMYYLDSDYVRKAAKQALTKRWWWSERLAVQEMAKTSLILADSPQDLRSFRQAPQHSRNQMMGNNEPFKEEELPQILMQKSYLKLDNHFYALDYSISETLKILDEHGKIKLKENIRYPLTYNFNNHDEIIRFTQMYFAKGSQGNHSPHTLWLVKNNNLKILMLCSNYKQIRQFLKQNSKNDSCFTVQQFINNPFLYKNKKVDIKAYILITRLNNITRCFWWKEGYVALSIEDYRSFDPMMTMLTDSQKINHQRMEIQAKTIPFSLFNQLCLDHNLKFLQEAVPIMKETAKHFISSKLEGFKIAPRPTFEILELSYILSSSKTPWLINVKPSSYHPIQSVMSCMIDDALKLTADLVFPPPSEWSLAKRFFMNKGYANNGFELLLDESDNRFHQSKASSSSGERTEQTTVEVMDFNE